MANSEPLCVKDFEKYLTEKLPKAWSNYISGGADEWSTHKNNQVSWKRLRIRPKHLTGITADLIDTSVDFLGCKLKTPICVTPAGLQCLAHEDGEVATMKGCLKNGNLMALSMVSTRSSKDVIKASSGHAVAAHIDVPKSRDLLDQELAAIEAEGFKFIILTVDTPVLGNRLQEKRSKVILPSGVSIPRIDFLVNETLNEHAKKGIVFKKPTDGEEYFALMKSNLSWQDVDYIIGRTTLPLVLKGILSAEDAADAVNHGVKGVIVSNHGGRQLDTAPSTVEALPEIIKAVDGRIPVFVDGGIRLGTDVFKALALGAKAVFIGRPIYWGLSYDGEEGVAKVLSILQKELEKTMALAGCQDLASISRMHVIHESALWSHL